MQGLIYEPLTELLSTLAAKEENLLKLMLQKEIDDEIPIDIVKTVDYHDVILSLESSRNEDDWQRASNSE